MTIFKEKNHLSIRLTKNDNCITELSIYHKEGNNWEAISDSFVCNCELWNKIQIQTYKKYELLGSSRAIYLQGMHLSS